MTPPRRRRGHAPADRDAARMRWDHFQSAKEVAKHLIYKSRLNPLLDGLRRVRGHHVDHLSSSDLRQAFERIYASGAWRYGSEDASASGLGSEIGAASDIARRLPGVLEDLECRVLLDVGCGDWTWMREVDLPCDYVGIDVVPSVIAQNRSHAREGVRFQTLDAVCEPLPQADVVLCREVLFHLGWEDGLRLLRNIKRSARWLLATSDTQIWFNSDIRTGDFRNINLQLGPYRLPPPSRVIPDDAVRPGRVLAHLPSQALPG